MTRDEILALPLDKLNELVTEKVMGECLHGYYDAQGQDHIECLKCHISRFYHQKSQAFVSDISAAWRVQKKMTEKGYAISLENYKGDGWYCHFHLPALSVIHNWVAAQPSAPEAICRVALLAMQRD